MISKSHAVFFVAPREVSHDDSIENNSRDRVAATPWERVPGSLARADYRYFPRFNGRHTTARRRRACTSRIRGVIVLRDNDDDCRRHLCIAAICIRWKRVRAAFLSSRVAFPISSPFFRSSFLPFSSGPRFWFLRRQLLARSEITARDRSKVDRACGRNFATSLRRTYEGARANRFHAR